MAQGVALITHSTGAIGKATAIQLAADGFDVALSDDASQQSAMSALEREIQSQGVRAQIFECDLLKEDSIQSLIDNVSRDMGGVDVMFINPLDSAVGFKPLCNTSTDEWDKMFAANARPVFLCYKHAAAQMIKQGRGGRLVACAGAGARQALFPNSSPFVAANFAIRGLTQTAALELGPQNITVNLISRGFLVDEERVSKTGHDFYDLEARQFSSGNKVQPIRAQFANRTPVPQKTVTGQDVARVVGLLASKDCKFMTGQTIAVSGGIVMD